MDGPTQSTKLKEVLEASHVEWVQLPFAGIESFFEAGVIDPELTWTCAKGIYGPACAEHALAFMLAAARRLHVHARAQSWSKLGLDSPEYRLDDKTVVVVGTGGIGVALVPMVQPLGLRIIGVNRSGRALEGAERTVVVDELDRCSTRSGLRGGRRRVHRSDPPSLRRDLSSRQWRPMRGS